MEVNRGKCKNSSTAKEKLKSLLICWQTLSLQGFVKLILQLQ